MTGRPESLWPLFGALEQLDGIGPKLAATLSNAGWEHPRDLLFSLPQSGVDRRLRETLGDASSRVATLRATVTAHHPPRKPGAPWRIACLVGDELLQIVFFRAQKKWIEKQLPIGGTRIVSGKLEWFDGIAQMAHPDYVTDPADAADIPAFEPVYPLTAGISQKLMRRATLSALNLAPDLSEWADHNLLAKRDWPGWRDALDQAHHPQTHMDVTADTKARSRLAYDELFAHQLTLALARSRRRRKAGVATHGTGAIQNQVLDALPFSPTGAQTRTVAEISADLAQPTRMMRLLQGDVGAGKTFVALMALLIVVEAGGQGVLMAPTEILARQHMAGLAGYLAQTDVRIEILTGRDNGAQRAQKLADLQAGRIHILVGTHAVFQDDVHFADLRLAVIDEQHRFGVAQRMRLGAKGQSVDVLVMTATPIPRSLALAQYGDLDVSILDEKPPGRSPVRTAVMPVTRLDDVVGNLRRAIDEGRQVYWVCPLVEESESSDKIAAEQRFKHLRAALGEGEVGLVHGQMPPADKDAAMADFQSGKTRVLVATTVIEVGVDVPNASIMVIERAESFGLAQLHQLRGRVGRGAAESTCLLLYQPPLSQTGQKRLEVLRETEDGFRISEEDLAIRGAGDVIGTAQSGLPRFQVADLERHASLMAVAQKDARALLEIDPDLSSERGTSARMLLWLMRQDQAIRLIAVG